jgi:hypothetical protein
MATQDQLRQIATRAMSDDAFAAKLQADPEGTLREENVTLSDEDKAAFNQMMEEAARAMGRESKCFTQ